MDDQPLSLQDLLLDTRQTDQVRHLRKIYPDPMTGSTEWGLEIDPDTRRIMGVFSLSTQKPIKVGNFPPGLETLNKKEFINEWVFSADTWANKELGVNPSADKKSNFFNPSIIGIRPNDKPVMQSQPPTNELINPSELGSQ
jgi:hypothetical protein